MKALQGGLIVALVAALVGCTSPTSTSTPEPSASSSTPPPAATRPAIVFDGDCDALLTADEVGTTTGSALTLSERPSDVPGLAVDQLGGIACSWEDGAGGLQAWVTILPVAALPAGAATDDAPYCYGGSAAAGEQEACSFGISIGDFWLAGVVNTGAGSGIGAVDAISALEQLATPRLSDEAVPERYLPADSWATDLDCAIFEPVDVAPILGTAVAPQTGDLPAEAGPGFYAATAAAGYRGCIWDSGSGGVEVHLLPGAAWAVEEGILVTGGDTIYATDGTNLLAALPYGSVSEQAATDLAALLLPFL